MRAISRLDALDEQVQVLVYHVPHSALRKHLRNARFTTRYSRPYTLLYQGQLRFVKGKVTEIGDIAVASPKVREQCDHRH